LCYTDFVDDVLKWSNIGCSYLFLLKNSPICINYLFFL